VQGRKKGVVCPGLIHQAIGVAGSQSASSSITTGSSMLSSSSISDIERGFMSNPAKCKEVKIKGRAFCLVPKEEFLATMRALEDASVNAKEFIEGSIAADLREKREAVGLTQVEVAKKAKMRQEVLSRIEGGQGNPTVATIGRILKAIKSLSRHSVVG
jgi:transcriptional regulator with XRE-family HTH domain